VTPPGPASTVLTGRSERRRVPPRAVRSGRTIGPFDAKGVAPHPPGYARTSLRGHAPSKASGTHIVPLSSGVQQGTSLESTCLGCPVEGATRPALFLYDWCETFRQTEHEPSQQRT